MLAAALVRGAAAWRRAVRRTNDWMRASQPLTIDGVSLPAFAIDDDAPVMALVGVLRPRLLITRSVFEALSTEELAAAAAHELGHRRAWDNLKRLAMRAAPDLLAFTPAARALERRWAAAAEHAADHVADDSGRIRCALASALVKVARLTPPAPPIAEPISTLIDGGDITSRVTRLLEDPPPDKHPGRARWLALGLAASAVALNYTPLLRTVHTVTELLVSTLP